MEAPEGKFDIGLGKVAGQDKALAVDDVYRRFGNDGKIHQFKYRRK